MAEAKDKPMSLSEAMNRLAASDYKVIRKIEDLLVKSGELSEEFADERDALRAAVRKAREMN